MILNIDLWPYFVLHACMQKHLGPALAETYFSLAPIIVELALPYILCGIAFVISYGLNSEISILFLSLYAMFMVSAGFFELLTVFPNNFLSVYRHRCSFYERHPERHGIPKQPHVPAYLQYGSRAVRSPRRQPPPPRLPTLMTRGRLHRSKTRRVG